MKPVTVVITVGPKPHHRRWLQEAVDSVAAQTIDEVELLVIPVAPKLDPVPSYAGDLRVWESPWDVGIPGIANLGVGLAKHDLVFFLSSDDIMRPWCLEDCLREYELRGDDLAYYTVDIEYSTGERQSLPSGPGMVTKALWDHTGGFPPETSVGASDYIFISLLNIMHGRAGRIWHVKSAEMPYWLRVHEDTTTLSRLPRWGGVVGPVRDILTEDWQARWPE